MALVDDSSVQPPRTHRIDVPTPNEGGGPSENWYERFLTSEESRLFQEAHHTGSGNASSLVFSETSSSTGLLHSANVQDGGSFGNHLITFEKPLLFPETRRDGPSNHNPLVIFNTSPSSDSQAQNANIHKPSEEGDSSETHLPTFTDSLFLPETCHDGSGNQGYSLFSSTDTSEDQQAQNAGIHNAVETEGSSGEESLFIPEIPPGGHTANLESVTENGQYYNVVGPQISTGLYTKELETTESALVHSDETDSLFVGPERYGNIETGRETCNPLIQSTCIKEPEPPSNGGNGREGPSFVTGKQSAVSFSKKSQEAVDLRHVQEDKPHVEWKPLKLEHMQCKTDIRKAVEDLHTTRAPKPIQSQPPNATTRRQKMTTPERKEARKRSSKQCEERKKEALRSLREQTSLNPLDTLRRSSSEITHASADGDGLGSANSPPGAIKAEGLVTAPRKRRMSTPERKEAKRRAAQKHLAKRKQEKLSQNGQSSSSPPDISRRSSSGILNGSSEDNSLIEKGAHCHSVMPEQTLSDPKSEVGCDAGANASDSQRPTTARKGVAKTQTTPSYEAVQPAAVRSEGPEHDEQEQVGTDTECEGTEEEMLFLYFVHRTQFRLDELDDEPMQVLYGPFHTLTEANTVASDVLLQFQSASSYSTEHSGGWKSDANGLKSWHFTSAITEVEVAVTREIKRNARLPTGAGRVPPTVYEAYQRRVEFGTTPAGNTFTHVHLGTFTLLDLANRHAARAWVAVGVEALPDTAYTREVVRLEKEKEMRGVCEELEARGGFFKRCTRVRREGGKGEGEMEVEVEVWVVEREVVGPRN